MQIDQDEQSKQLAALRQWLVSQDIPMPQWTPLCMALVGQDIAMLGGKDIAVIFEGLQLATCLLVSQTQRAMRNAQV